MKTQFLRTSELIPQATVVRLVLIVNFVSLSELKQPVEVGNILLIYVMALP